MAKFGKRSLDNLKGVDPDLVKIVNIVIKVFDFSVLAGVRTAPEQFELYKIGRTLKNGQWMITGKKVTDCDGYIKKSAHQFKKAVDVAPYPIDWDDTDRFYELSRLMFAVADALNIKIKWLEPIGDLPHFQKED